VNFHSRGESGTRCPAFALLDPTELTLGEPFDLRLRNACLLAEFPNRGAISLVVSLRSLVRLPELFRINGLQELIPSQVDVEVRPVEE
jgi:hypothetical protein